MESDFDYIRDHLIGAIGATGDAVTAQGKLQDAMSLEIGRLWADNAALRDELHAVANRLEALTNFVTTAPAEVAERMIDRG
jgi:long-subunit fatty acid transport protein